MSEEVIIRVAYVVVIIILTIVGTAMFKLAKKETRIRLQEKQQAYKPELHRCNKYKQNRHTREKNKR